MVGLAVACVVAPVLLVLGGMVLARERVSASAEGKVYGSVEDIPAPKVASVLGCVRMLANGRENLYSKYRMAAAHELFLSGKSKFALTLPNRQ